MRMLPRFLSGLLCLCLLCGLPLAVQAQDDPGQALLDPLATASYAEKGEAIEAIIESGDARSRRWLEALLGGKLQRHKNTGRFVVVVENRGRNWPVVDALSFEDAGEMSRRDLDRIGINNALRGQLQGALAVLDLHADESPSVARRPERCLALSMPAWSSQSGRSSTVKRTPRCVACSSRPCPFSAWKRARSKRWRP